jgi:hypothetical protein
MLDLFESPRQRRAARITPISEAEDKAGITKGVAAKRGWRHGHFGQKRVDFCEKRVRMG